MKHSGNIPIFNIAGTLLGNFPRNYIVSFFRIFREYIMRMLHEYSMNILIKKVDFQKTEPYASIWTN